MLMYLEATQGSVSIDAWISGRRSSLTLDLLRIRSTYLNLYGIEGLFLLSSVLNFLKTNGAVVPSSFSYSLDVLSAMSSRNVALNLSSLFRRGEIHKGMLIVQGIAKV